MSAFLELRDLRTHFPIYRGLIIRRKIASVKAVDGISLTLKKAKFLVWSENLDAGNLRWPER